MLTRSMTVSRFACAVLALVLCATVVRAEPLVDHFEHATDPDLAGATRTLSNPSNIFVIDTESVATYDGGAVAGLLYSFATPINLTGGHDVYIDFYQIADADDNPKLADIDIEVGDGFSTATLGPTALPYVVGTGALTRLIFDPNTFINTASVNRAAITSLTITFDGEGGAFPIVIVADSIGVVPAPSAASAGLLGLAMLVARRRR